MHTRTPELARRVSKSIARVALAIVLTLGSWVVVASPATASPVTAPPTPSVVAAPVDREIHYGHYPTREVCEGKRLDLEASGWFYNGRCEYVGPEWVLYITKKSSGGGGGGSWSLPS